MSKATHHPGTTVPPPAIHLSHIMAGMEHSKVEAAHERPGMAYMGYDMSNPAMAKAMEADIRLRFFVSLVLATFAIVVNKGMMKEERSLLGTALTLRVLILKVPTPLWCTIASFGGYLNRKCDGPLGWQTECSGWFYIQTI